MTLLQGRAQGKPGAGRTRSLVCEWKKHTSKSPQARPGQPDLPCAMVLTVSSALSPVTGRLLSPSPRIAPRLSASLGAPGPYGFSVRDRIARRATQPTSIASRLAFVTTRPPLEVSRDGGR
jgi:hypothetical protein